MLPNVHNWDKVITNGIKYPKGVPDINNCDI